MNEALYGVKPTTTKYGDMQFRYLAINAIKRIRNETPFSQRMTDCLTGHLQHASTIYEKQ